MTMRRIKRQGCSYPKGGSTCDRFRGGKTSRPISRRTEIRASIADGEKRNSRSGPCRPSGSFHLRERAGRRGRDGSQRPKRGWPSPLRESRLRCLRTTGRSRRERDFFTSTIQKRARISNSAFPLIFTPKVFIERQTLNEPYRLAFFLRVSSELTPRKPTSQPAPKLMHRAFTEGSVG